MIRLTPAENRLDTIYSLRTLSADSPEALRAMAAPEEGARLLRDDAGRLFVELGQYDTREKAERAAGDRGAAGLIVERRTGNNVPVCYETEEAYQSAVLLDGYNDLLQTTVEVEPILAFLEEHLAGASAEVQDTMGADRGLLCYGGTDAARKIPMRKAEEHETEIPETDIGAAPAGRTDGLRHGQGGRCGRHGGGSCEPERRLFGAPDGRGGVPDL